MGASYKLALACLFYFIVDGYSYQPTQGNFQNVGFKMPYFNATADTEAVKHALYANDLHTLVNILTHRLYDQRLEIANKFKLQYGKYLKEEMLAHAGDDLKHFLVALIVPTPVFFANELHDAIIGIGTNEKVLIQILCTLSNSEMLSVIHAYDSEFHHKLIDDVKGDTSGDFKGLMKAVLQAKRDVSGATNKVQAIADAKHLHSAGLDKIGTDEETFYEILTTRNYYQIRLICDEYKHLSGHDLEYAIEKEFSSYAREGLLTIVAAAKNLPAYFAGQLNHCMTADDKKNEQLIRIVVPRSKTDMGYIKQEYYKTFHKNLDYDITEHTQGLFKDGLLNLIN